MYLYKLEILLWLEGSDTLMKPLILLDIKDTKDIIRVLDNNDIDSETKTRIKNDLKKQVMLSEGKITIDSQK